MTGWDGKLVEEFRRLGRMRHGLDPHPAPRAGTFTATPPGGWADLRSTHGAALADSPFDEFHHTPDLRRPRGRDGRFGIQRIGLHLYRLRVSRIDGVWPCIHPNNSKAFTIDPSGRDVSLFIQPQRIADRQRGDWEDWTSAREWEVPSPLQCRILNHAPLQITEQILATILKPHLQAKLPSPPPPPPTPVDTALDFLRRFRAQPIPSDVALWNLIEALPLPTRNAIRDAEFWPRFLAAALVPDCAKRALLPEGVAPKETNPNKSMMDTSKASLVVATKRTDLVSGSDWVPAAREQVVGANLENWIISNPAGIRQWAVDPVRGRLLWIGPGNPPQHRPRVSACYAFSMDVGAGGHDRSADTRTQASQFFSEGDKALQKPLVPLGVAEISDSASYSPVGDIAGIRDLTLRAANLMRPYMRLTQDWALAAAPPSNNPPPNLRLEGLWIGSADALRTMVLRGTYDEVVLRHVTLDPGGEGAWNQPIHPVALVVEGHVRSLVIERCIISSVRVDPAGSITDLHLRDSIVDGQCIPTPAGGQLRPPIQVPGGKVHAERTTVFGNSQGVCAEVEWLHATESLFIGRVTVVNTQEGCFRFSATAAPVKSRVPHPYESHAFTHGSGFFTSTTFGHPGYAQLAASAPAALHVGAENGSQIGAFSANIEPIKHDSLRAKVEEFAPFGILPAYILET